MSALQDLRRNTADRKLTGLCGGIARQWHIDPLLVRILAVLLVLSGGLGVVLYAFGWLLVPEDGSTERTVHRLLPQSKTWSREVWIVILVVAAVVFVSVLGQFIPIGLMPALIIAAVWYFGFRKAGSGSGATAAPPPSHDPLAGPSTPFTDAARAWQERVAQYEQVRRPDSQSADPWGSATDPAASGWPTVPTAGTTPTPQTHPAHTHPAHTHPAQAYVTQPYPSQPYPSQVAHPVDPPSAEVFYSHPDPAGIYAANPAPTPLTGPTGPGKPNAQGATALAPRRPGSLPAARRVRLAVLIVAGLALAGLGLADVLGVPVPLVVYLATALLVVGLGLVVAGWTGRARGLLPIGVLLLIATLVTSIGSASWQRYGSTEWAPQQRTYTTLTDLPRTDAFEVGQYEIDLNGLTVDRNQSYDVVLDVGSVRIDLPDDHRVRVEASTDVGSLNLPDAQDGGPDITVTRTYGPNDPDLPLLTLTVHVDVGNIEVVR